MRQRKWLDVVKDYDSKILYHPGKANVVVDALSRKVESAPIRDVCMMMTVVTPVLDTIREAQAEAVRPENRKRERVIGQASEFVTDSRGLMTFRGRIWVPYTGGAHNILMEEAHRSRFSIHPGVTKMYLDLKRDYWSPCMKRDVAWVVERCLTCRRVKAEHQRHHDPLQALEISPVEVGTDLYGLHHQVTDDCAWS
ncbi:unnamed protein product [Lactuca virosa]|uniref:Integrase zinc-binding domain-containing protein n=1 Tax=Lactuca virosa TaxID=75947 RepID=A0AAU9NH69_9ASTR|nr:unnamed protein product [Lactuca virosa]